MNCKITENYFAEKARMTGANDNGTCMIECAKCPLSLSNNGECESCFTLEKLYYNKAIEIVQKWSDEHPQKTILDDLKEKYPNYHTVNNEIPTFCPYRLGYEENKKCKKFTCKECWNRPLDEVIKK